MGSKSEDKTCLKKDLRLIDLFCIASGAMISSGLFILPGIAFADVGPSLIWAYLLASALVIPAMLSKAEMATAMPKAGGDYYFIDRSVGPLMGTIAGFAAWFSLAFKSAFALIGIGVFAQLLNPGFGELEAKAVAVLFCLIFTVVNMRGVKHAGRTQIILVAGLIALLLMYIAVGVTSINPSNFDGLFDASFSSIFATAGLIFVSFGGLTKICSVAEECKRPGRNLPLGMFLSWGLISLLYFAVVSVTIGVVPANLLGGATRPISLGADVLLGSGGAILMAIAAVLAFVSTGNAGLMAASRSPMAMSKDQLLPKRFAQMNKNGTPVFSILFTSAFMIAVILFLDLKDLVKTASLLKILLFMFVMFSLIVMRESGIRNYQPKYKTPLYPWLQIVGIAGLILLIIEMGFVPILIVCGFVGFAFVWYWLYARDKIWREYTFLHLVEKLTGQQRTGYMVDEELREILIERDALSEASFATQLEHAEVIDLFKYLLPDEFNKMTAKRLSTRLKVSERKLYKTLGRKETDSSVMVHPGLAIFSHIIPGRDRFGMLLIRSRKGLIIAEDKPPIHAFFFVISTPDKKSFYLHSLMWLLQLSENIDFSKQWLEAEGPDELREILREAWLKRNKEEF